MLLTSSQANPHGFCAKISDFGLARNLDLVSRVETKTTGTVTHMPPEVLSDGIISKARYCDIPLPIQDRLACAAAFEGLQLSHS